jgi:hypothetical protein
MRFERRGSAEIVKEMVRKLGQARTIEILEVTEQRLKSLLNERGCLTRDQLQSIDKQTGTSWPRWFVEGTADFAKTPEDRAFVDRARQMWDEIDHKSTPWEARSFPRPKKTASQRRVKIRQAG